MNFEDAYLAFIQSHLSKRTGERRTRLEHGQRFAEKSFCKNVWWPIHGNFAHLHPEYEVSDWRGRPFFCDFVWSPDIIKIAIEIKGFGPHVQEMDRVKYCRELNRETFLTAMGYQVISFSYDDVAERPQLCVSLLRMVLARFLPITHFPSLHSAAEREIIRLACFLGRPLRPIDVRNQLGLSYRGAAKLMNELCAKGLFSTEMGKNKKNIVRYTLHPQGVNALYSLPTY